MNDVDEVVMWTGHRFTTQLIVESWRNFFKQKYNMDFPETKLDYVQEGGELRNILEAYAQEFLTNLHYINEGVIAKFIKHSDGEMLDDLAYPEIRKLATSSNGCVLWRYIIPALQQIKNIFKTYSIRETSSESIFNTDNPLYDGRRLPVPIFSYNNNYDELNDRYPSGSVPLAGDFAIMREITTFRTPEGNPLFRSKTESGSYKYYYSEDIYKEITSIDPDTGETITSAEIIHYINEEYTSTNVTSEYGDYFIAVWNKNTSSWNRKNFPQGLIIPEGAILTTDPKDIEGEELEFEIILSSNNETDNDNLDIECRNNSVTSIRDTFLTSCGVENSFDILLNYNISSCNWTMRLPVESVGTGTEYNIKKNTLVNFDSSQFNIDVGDIDFLSVTNPNDFINAIDDEDDDTFKERVLTKKKKCGFGTVRWHDLTTRDIAGVEDVKIINRPKGDWTASIVVKPNDQNIIKSVKCFFSNPCNTLLGLNIGVEGVEYRVIDKILIPYIINENNANNGMTHQELDEDTQFRIKEFFSNSKIGESLTADKINEKIDTLPGVALELDKNTGFYYYENNENVMKNSPILNTCDTCCIYVAPENIYFSMKEFNPDYDDGMVEE